MIKQTLFKGEHFDGCRDHYGEGEILALIPSLTRTNGHLHSGSRVGVSGWKVTKRKQQK